MINEVLILQIFSLMTLFYFINTFNILTVWYLAGIYLVLLGWYLLLDDGDIFVGFLWVIDLGVGLIFFMFILHYSTFLHQKVSVEKTSLEFSFVTLALLTSAVVFYFTSFTFGAIGPIVFAQTWFLLISWYDYFDIFFSATVTDLNFLHEIYFTNNSFEFFLINFFLLYGVVVSILLTFLVKRVFNYMNFSQFQSSQMLHKSNSTFFIRNQDYLKQQATSSGTRIWNKEKQTRL